MRHVDVVALMGALGWLILIIELVRQRRFSEGYALLWLFSGVALVILALWRDLLDILARLMGIYYAPTALFVVAVGFLLLLSVQQSMLLCQLQQRNNDLAQRIALLTLHIERLQERIDAEGPASAEGTT